MGADEPVEPSCEGHGDAAPDAADLTPVWPSAGRTLGVAAVTTVVVTALSHLAPDSWANTAVGGAFLLATWLLVLRHDSGVIRQYGLSLGGLTEPRRIDGRQLFGDTARAIAWALLLALIVFPPFWFGFRYWWKVDVFVWRLPPGWLDQLLGQLLVIALPEEAFFRGYLQSALDGRWAGRTKRILGAEVGPGMLLTAAVFALGHLLTIPNPARLAVFFPALLFGWLRARTGGIGASVLFHAMCNTYSSMLVAGHGL